MYLAKVARDAYGWSTALPSPPYAFGLRAVEFSMDLRIEGQPMPEEAFETVFVRMVIEIDDSLRRVGVLFVEFQ